MRSAWQITDSEASGMAIAPLLLSKVEICTVWFPKCREWRKDRFRIPNSTVVGPAVLF